MKLSRKLSKKETMLKERLYDISYINNLESDDLVETINMIVKKGLELELLHEFNFEVTPNDLLQLLSRVSLKNHLQRRYKNIVQSELLECK